jgi:hypothetical protein
MPRILGPCLIGQRDKKPPALLSSTIAHAVQLTPWTAQLIRRSESSFCFQLFFQNVGQCLNSGSAFWAFPRWSLGVIPTIVLADGV